MALTSVAVTGSIDSGGEAYGAALVSLDCSAASAAGEMGATSIDALGDRAEEELEAASYWLDGWGGNVTRKTPGRRQLVQLTITIQVELRFAKITTPSPG